MEFHEGKKEILVGANYYCVAVVGNIISFRWRHRGCSFHIYPVLRDDI